jgi:hypothetical protein
MGNRAVVLAQEQIQGQEIKIGMSPTKIELDIAPGGHYEGTFKVINSGEIDLDFQVYVAPYFVEGEDYSPVFEGAENLETAYLLSWVELATSSGQLAAGTSQEIGFTIDVPLYDIPNIGQYLVFFAESGITTNNAQAGINFRQRVGTLLYGRLAGATREEGAIFDFGFGKPVQVSVNGVTKIERRAQWFFWKGPAMGWATVSNNGNIHFAFKSRLLIEPIFPKKGEALEVAVNEGSYVLPGTQRRVELSWDKLPWLGLFNAKFEVTFLGETYARDFLLVVCHPYIMIGVGTGVALLVAIGVGRRLKKKSNRKKS